MIDLFDNLDTFSQVYHNSWAFLFAYCRSFQDFADNLCANLDLFSLIGVNNLFLYNSYF